MDCAWCWPHAPKPTRPNRTGCAGMDETTKRRRRGLFPQGAGQGRDGTFNPPSLDFVEPAGGKARENVLGEEVALVLVRVAAEDEGAHAHVHVAVELGEHLIRITDQRAAASTASEADARPDMRL